MKNSKSAMHENYPDLYHDAYSRTLFGFWLYLMSDFILFGVLFATYAVLSINPFQGPTGRELFHPPYTLTQTLILLVGSLTAGLGAAAAHRQHKKPTILFFSATFLIGLVFMGMIGTEFSRLIQEGNSWDKNGFLSAYFTVVSTHAIHVLFGLLWIVVLLIPVWKEGVSDVSVRRLTCLNMFWQFLNIIWVFIFALVYLLGVV
jgi:cytochrome o ubiquinol oxidase subunit 3